MSPAAWGELLTFLNNPTFLGLVLVLIVWGGMREWWVFGREYRRLLKELTAKQEEVDRWQAMALDNLTLADRASAGAVRAASTARRSPRPPRGESDP